MPFQQPPKSSRCLSISTLLDFSLVGDFKKGCERTPLFETDIMIKDNKHKSSVTNSKYIVLHTEESKNQYDDLKLSASHQNNDLRWSTGHQNDDFGSCIYSSFRHKGLPATCRWLWVTLLDSHCNVGRHGVSDIFFSTA